MGKKILFLGTHGQHNLGDELLLETFLAQLGSEHQYYVNSYDPDFTFRQLHGVYQVQVFHTTNDKFDLLQLIAACDVVFFGGGSIIKELNTSVGRNRYAPLLMVLALVTFANLVMRKQIIMSNIGVGPLHTWVGRLLAGIIVRQVELVAVRDQQSFNTCLALNVWPRRLVRVPDAVFAHRAADWRSQSIHCASPTVPLKVALNLNYDLANPANWEYFATTLAQTLEAFAAQRPLEIHALPMQSRFKSHHDLVILADFARHLPTAVVKMHHPRTAADAAAIVAGCDIVVAERLHTIVIAAILGKPVLPLVYDVKVGELVRQLDLDEYAVDINTHFSPHTLMEKLVRLVQQQTDVSRQLAGRATALHGELTEYFQQMRAMIAAA
jgi:polysaccharide pyruvyl transferase WcaK-like protein